MHSEEERTEDFVCKSHSGLIARINGLYAIITILIALVGAQMMFQVPAMKYDILKEMTKVTDTIAEGQKTDIKLDGEIRLLAQQLNNHIQKLAVP